jgi:hypothetical protein
MQVDIRVKDYPRVSFTQSGPCALVALRPRGFAADYSDRNLVYLSGTREELLAFADQVREAVVTAPELVEAHA